MGRQVEIPITPGGQISDVAKHDLGSSLHQLVKNLRMKKLNVWEMIETGADVKTGFTNIKAAIEMSEDASGDRFILYQDGTTLNRLDFDEGDGNGYENESPATLTLPSGVTIGASAVLKFFVFRGVVRISGATVPLWYGYVDRTLFSGADSFTVQTWVLEKAEILWPAATNDLQFLDADNIPTTVINAATDLTSIIYLKFFYVFDGGQFEILKEIDNLETGSTFNFTNLQHEYVIAARSSAVQLHLRVNGSTLKSNMFNERITGVALAVVRKPYAASGVSEDVTAIYDEEKETFQVPIVLNIDDDLGEVSFVVRNAAWDSTQNTELEITDTTNDFYLSFEAGFLGVDVEIEITFEGTSESHVVASINFGDTVSTPALLTVDDSMAALFGSTGDKTNVGIKITRKWQYDASNGYHTYVGINALALGAKYKDFVGFPQATTDNNPNYIHHAVVAERPYASGMTGDEADSVRFGPLNQFDNFPETFIIQTEAGDADKVKAIVKMDDRLAIIKQKTLNMGNFAGATYRENIGKVLQGMRPTGDQDAFFSLGGLVYIMDVEDVWAFDGLNAISIFKDLLIRKFYQDNVDANSFIFYDKKNDEMIFVLGNSKILCWARERNLFYERNWGTAPVFAYLSETNTLILALNSGVELVDVNGSGELAINWAIKTATMGRPHRWLFKVKEILTFLKTTNGNVDITITDTNESVDETVTLTAPATLQSRVSNDASFKRFVKELFVEIESTGETAGNTAEIHESLAIVEVWK